MVINSFKSVTKEDLGFQQPEQVHVYIVKARNKLVDLVESEPVKFYEPIEDDKLVAELVEPPQLLQKQMEEKAMKKREDNSLGGLDFLMIDWVQQQLKDDLSMSNYQGIFIREQEEIMTPIVKAL